MASKFSRLSQGAFILRSLRNTSLAALLWISIASAQPAPKVTLLVPDPPGISPFWGQMIEVMQAAAEDLKIDLQFAYSKPNSYSLKKDGLAALNTPDKPDYFLSGYWIASTEHHIQRAEQLGIRTFIFNSGVAPKEREEISRPRKKYKHWIGQMTPDDLQAGYILTDILIDKAKTASKTNAGKIHLAGLGGWGDKSEIEEDRYGGLDKRIHEQNDAILDKFVLAGWTQVTAYNELLEVLKQYPKISVIWCAGDTMALGAIEAVENLGKTPGRDIFIGGMDWSRDGIDAVISGKMAVTMGGHFLEGAKALILIHDYHHGFDFANGPGLVMRTQLKPITADNAEEYRDKLSKLDWHEVDFKRFSKKYNANLKNYDFSLDTLLNSPELSTTTPREKRKL